MPIFSRPIGSIVVAFALLATALTNSSQAQQRVQSTPIQMTRLDHKAVPVDIDGQLDESIWTTLPTVGTFSVVEPDTLVPERYPTELRLFYTEKGIYVGMAMQQPRETLVGRLSSRDQRTLNRDAVFITFDSSSEGHYGYWFGIALGGSLMDGTILPERRFATDWDGAWRGATAVTDAGWSAEMFLPWSMMGMPHTRGERQIGVYVSRKVAYLNERWGWPPLPETQPKFMSVLDRLQFVDIAPTQQYSLFPYASVTVDNVKDETVYKAGADVFWRPSTDFQLTATLNPDFGTIEADDVIVNLSAIETFFPEKRLFFLESRDIFIAAPRASPNQVNTGNPPTTLLNTRRIGGRAYPPSIPSGITVSSVELTQPAELLGAVKATGSAGGVRYGVLAATEDDTDFAGVDAFGNSLYLEQEGRNYGVARFLYEDAADGAYRGLGWMTTLADHPLRRSIVHGLDTHYLTPNGKWQWDSQLFRSDIDTPALGTESTGNGGFIDAKYSPRRGRSHTLSLDYYDKEVNINDLGQFRRNDVMGAKYVFQQRTADISFGRDSNLVLTAQYEMNTDRQLVRAGLFSEGFVIRDNLTEWRFYLNAFPGRFEDRNSFGNGIYRIEPRAHALVGYSTDTSRRLAALFDVRYEIEELGGHFFSEQAMLVWRPLDRLTTDVTIYRRDRDGWLLHEGGTSRRMLTFDAKEWSFKFNLDFFFNARHQVRASLQWVGIKALEEGIYAIPASPGDLIPTTKLAGEPTDDFDISTVNFQLRYRWEMAPMSDLFLVYTKNGNRRGLPLDGFTTMFTDVYRHPIAEQLVLKVRYRFGN